MAQRVSLDRLTAAFYLALVTAACNGSMAPVIPEHALTVAPDSATAWMATTVPAGRWLHRFKWQYQDDRGAAGGRGSAHIAGADTIRFDVAGPLGASPAAAMVVSDSPVWVRPEDAIRKLVPSYPLMWATFAVARAPVGARVVWAGRAGESAVWRAVAGEDTIEWARSPGRLVAEARRHGAIVGRVDTRIGADGHPLAARLTMPAVPARLDLTFTLSDSTARFPSDVWRPREP